MNMTTKALVGIAATAVLSAGAVTATAQPTAGAPSARHAPTASPVALVFVKNAKDPSNSVLQVWNGKTHVTSYRAGSGLGTAANDGTAGGQELSGRVREERRLAPQRHVPTVFVRDQPEQHDQGVRHRPARQEVPPAQDRAQRVVHPQRDDQGQEAGATQRGRQPAALGRGVGL